MAVISFIISSLYTAISFAGFIAFVVLNNYPGAILAFLSGVINCALSHLHFLKHKNRLQDWYTKRHIESIGRFGMVMFTFGAMSFAYFLVIQIMLKKEFTPISDSSIIPIVWGVICSKSGLILKWYAVKYSCSDDSLINNEEAAVPGPGSNEEGSSDDGQNN